MQGLLKYIETKVKLPNDSREEAVRKSSFFLLLILTVIPAGIWVIVCRRLGLIYASYIPLAYIMIMGIMCFPIFLSKKLHSLCVYIQFSALLLLPIMLQGALGGMKKSGILMLWGILAPLGAAIFGSIKGAVIVFSLYIMLGTLAVASDIQFKDFAPMLPASNRLFFTFNFVLVSTAVFGIILYTMLKIKKQRRELELERNQVSSLLLNTLPAKTVEELLEHGKTYPDKFQNVTVMFSDFQGFTETSATISPSELIAELNEIFTAFDSIIEQYNCERIKTIGDAYLGVCGMPEQDSLHAENIINSAFDFVRYLTNRNAHFSQRTEIPAWQVRIGIHSGEVIGGVVGVKKYIYDIFGDTVNKASRMEILSEPMKINVSETTYNLVKDNYQFVKRPIINVKGLGAMQTYFVEKQL